MIKKNKTAITEYELRKESTVNEKFIQLERFNKFVRRMLSFIYSSFSSVRSIFPLHHSSVFSVFWFYASLLLFREINRVLGATESVNSRSGWRFTSPANEWRRTT